jgi:DNA-binding XRE family transcriptional regulator
MATDKQMQISLWNARLTAGYGLKEASERLHIPLDTLIAWEQCKIIPSLENACAMCSLYDIPYEMIQWTR